MRVNPWSETGTKSWENFDAMRTRSLLVPKIRRDWLALCRVGAELCSMNQKPNSRTLSAFTLHDLRIALSPANRWAKASACRTKLSDLSDRAAEGRGGAASHRDVA